MKKTFKDWLRLYLFYGVIFFSIGLLGVFLSRGVDLEVVANRFYQIAHPNPDNLQEVQAFNVKRAPLIIFLHQDTKKGPITRKVEERIRSIYPKMINLEAKIEPEIIQSLEKVPYPVIGVVEDSDNNQLTQSSLLFTMPQTTIGLFMAELANIKGFFSYQIKRVNQGEPSFYLISVSNRPGDAVIIKIAELIGATWSQNRVEIGDQEL